MNDDIEILRNQLRELHAWPEAGDTYLQMLTHTHTDPYPFTPEDGEWISVVIRDARLGKDIGANYPAFFKKLLTNSSLRRQFIMQLAQHLPTQ